MSDLFDYLTWRGDIPLSQVPFSAVDGLILSTLAYIHFDGLVRPDLSRPVSIGQTAQDYFALPEHKRGRTRCKTDLELLRALARSSRFAPLELVCYADQLLPEQEMQFAALTVLLEDGSAFLAFRGTDSTLVGWKEDFNMSFLDTVPAQQAALDYTERFAAGFPGFLRLGGHSKGGNLAVYAASLCPSKIRDRILSVYNNDGPGFTAFVRNSPGYQELLTRIFCFVPQSSVVGMLLEHEESYTVVKSRQIGLLQHDPYSWGILGGDFIRLEEVTAGSRIADQTVKAWIAGLTIKEREQFVDTVFELLSSGGASSTGELIQPRSLYAALQALRDVDGSMKRLLVKTLAQLIRAASEAWQENVPD